MDPAQRFSIDSDRVVHETIDGETIIIHLETGTYYSLAEVGAEVWSMLASGSSTGEIADSFEQRYEATRDQIDHAVATLVDELRREELVSAGEEAPGNEADDHDWDDRSSSEGREPFDAPKLQKYTDMQYFLLLDPIHEVDASGWPNLQGEREAR